MGLGLKSLLLDYVHISKNLLHCLQKHYGRIEDLLDCALTFVVYNTMKHKPLRCITKWCLIISIGTCRKWCFLIMDKHHQCSWKPPLSRHGSKSEISYSLDLHGINLSSFALPCVSRWCWSFNIFVKFGLFISTLG